MNPTATLRFRRATALAAVAWAVLGLGLAVGRQANWRLGPPLVFEGRAAAPWRVLGAAPGAEAAGVRPGDRLVALDGEPIERAMLSGRHRFAPGRADRYRFERRDGTTFEAVLRPTDPRSLETPLRLFARLAFSLIGLIYLATGLIVWRLRPDRAETWALALFCSTMGMALFLPPYPGGLTWILYWFNLPLVGATTFHLFTTYPSEPPWVVRRPGVRAAVYAVALAIGCAAASEGLLGLRLGVAKTAALYFTLSTASGCLMISARERRRLRESTAAGRADVMMLGALVSFLPAVTALLAENLLGSRFPWFLGLLSVFVFPLAVGYGIVRRQLFEIRMVALSSVAYGAATLAITGIYAFLITFADALVSRFDVDAHSPWFSVAFLFFAILAFNPLRSRMQGPVDRLFDRDHALYRRALREISEAMVSMLSVKEVVDRILVALTDTMGLERALILLQDDETRELAPVASRGEWDDESLALAISTSHPICRRLLSERDALARGDFDDEPDLEVREACRDVFDQLEVELVVPILFGADLLGLIAIGPKLSGDRLTADDRQLLLTLANQSSIAIENARAFDEIANLNATLEARVEERTHELRETQAQLMQSEKMRSLGQLVAGVAHELNNPIGFVHANLQLLDDYVQKLVAAQLAGEDASRYEAAIEKLLGRSREGTERVKQIVQDLRTFSRMDQAELAEVDLNEEIERTIALMEPRFKGGVAVERDYGELPPVRCYAGQLNQVFMNLLMNACDALEGRGTIQIRTRARPGGVRLEFRDDGPGIPPEDQARIFEPFFTTKPVGKGTGLGLSISYGIVERHGGRMLLGSAPGEGTTFVIELPLEPPPESAGADAS
jgi:two-component system NtrC family sensor kinase